MTAAGGKSAKGLTLDTGALLALEHGSPRVRALLRRALKAGLPLSVPACVVTSIANAITIIMRSSILSMALVFLRVPPRILRVA